MEFEIYRNDDGTGALTMLHEGESYMAQDSHRNFRKIIEALLDGDYDRAIELHNIEAEIASFLSPVSERVSISNGRVYFDGDESDSLLAKEILRHLGEEDEQSAARDVVDFMPLVNFYEKIMTNPNEHSREQLFNWLHAHPEFTITLEGDFIAYKGVSRDFRSHTAGVAYVDGRRIDGHIPNQVGTRITMPRSEVQHDPANGCSKGLHVATYPFAANFGEVVLAVIVNPRDVVSVPTDCDAEKMRVCGYDVVEVKDEPYKRIVVSRAIEAYDEDEEDDDEVGGCGHCGCECTECDCVYDTRCEECGCGGEEEEGEECCDVCGESGTYCECSEDEPAEDEKQVEAALTPPILRPVPYEEPTEQPRGPFTVINSPEEQAAQQSPPSRWSTTEDLSARFPARYTSEELEQKQQQEEEAAEDRCGDPACTICYSGDDVA